MKLLLVLTVLLALQGTESKCPSPRRPAPPLDKLCSNGTQCINYKVEESNSCYEVRHYPEGNWAAAEIHSPDKFKDFKKAWKRLSYYLNGKNTKGRRIKPVYPVGHVFFYEEGGDLQSAAAAVYLPEEHQATPPLPLGKGLHISKEGPYKLYVRAFGSTKKVPVNQISDEFEILANALVEEKIYDVEWATPIIFAYFGSSSKVKRFEVAFIAKTNPKPKPFSEICRSATRPDLYRCAEYESSKINGSDLEIRLYKEHKMAVTEIKDFDYYGAFNRLRRYLGGNNYENITYNRTYPLVLAVSLTEDYRNISEQYLGVFLPPEVEYPAEPYDQIQIVDSPRRKVIVRAFGDELNLDNAARLYTKNFQEMFYELHAKGMKVKSRDIFAMAYDDIGIKGSQRHEVGVVLGSSDDPEKPKAFSEICRSETRPNLPECAKFQSYPIGDTEYEIRVYFPHTVAATPIYNNDYESAFLRLQRYLKGNNTNDTQYDMAIPVTLSMKLSDDMDSLKEQYLAVGLPHSVKEPADPLDSNVHVFRTPHYSVLVKAFGGKVDENNAKEVYEKQFTEMFAAVKRYNIPVSHTDIFALAYDHPGASLPQRHEVGVLIKHKDDDDNKIKPLSEICRSDVNPELLECARFSSFDTGINATDVEGRIYDRHVMVEVDLMKGITYEDAFSELRSYIDGQNIEKMVYNMTVPVTTILRFDSDEDHLTEAKIAFALPSDAEYIAEPTSTYVRVVKYDHHKVIVKSFGGNIPLSKLEAAYERKFREFARDLEGTHWVDLAKKNGYAFGMEYEMPGSKGPKRHEIGIMVSL